LFWDGTRWTGQGWYPDPHDPEQRVYWDGSTWTGHRRSLAEPPFTPPVKLVKKDWATIAGMALGAAIVATSTVSNENAKRRARRASFARDWDLGGAQFTAQRQHEQYNNYLRLHNQWVQNNWDNPSPPPPPLPPTY
jgi:hypothetical protein